MATFATEVGTFGPNILSTLFKTNKLRSKTITTRVELEVEVTILLKTLIMCGV